MSLRFRRARVPRQESGSRSATIWRVVLVPGIAQICVHIV